MTQTDHPQDEEIAAFLDGTLSSSDRAAVVRHLAACDDCRALLGTPNAGSSGTRKVVNHRRRAMWPALATAAAAAVVVIAVSRRPARPEPEVDQLRAGDTSVVQLPVLEATSPANGALVSTDTLVLRWASAGSGATYDVSIVDQAGGEIWSTRLDSTGLRLPPDVRGRLRANSTYYWRVDALLPDLRTTSTGPRGFVPLAR